jgi:hypothetical protein
VCGNGAEALELLDTLKSVLDVVWTVVGLEKSSAYAAASSAAAALKSSKGKKSRNEDLGASAAALTVCKIRPAVTRWAEMAEPISKGLYLSHESLCEGLWMLEEMLKAIKQKIK